MRIFLISIAVVIALVVVTVGIGYSLPIRHRATATAALPIPADRLFAIITNVSDAPTWRSRVKRVEIVPVDHGSRQFREIGDDGAILYAMETVEPNSRFVTRIADPKLAFGGTWTYELAPTAGATTLRITEDGEVYNPVFRFVSRFVMGHTRTIDTYLADLGARVAREPGARLN